MAKTFGELEEGDFFVMPRPQEEVMVFIKDENGKAREIKGITDNGSRIWRGAAINVSHNCIVQWINKESFVD